MLPQPLSLDTRVPVHGWMGSCPRRPTWKPLCETLCPIWSPCGAEMRRGLGWGFFCLHSGCFGGICAPEVAPASVSLPGLLRRGPRQWPLCPLSCASCALCADSMSHPPALVSTSLRQARDPLSTSWSSPSWKRIFRTLRKGQRTRSAEIEVYK